MSDTQHEEIPSFLRKTGDHKSIADQDAERRAAENGDAYVPEQVDIDQGLAQTLQDLGATAEQPPAPESVSSSLAKQADVPYFGVTDGIGRDLATKIAEGKQRLEELAHDIEMSKTHRDRMADLIRSDLELTIEDMRRRAESAIGEIDQNHLEEVAILRGRETDQIKGVSTLEATLALLQRGR